MPRLAILGFALLAAFVPSAFAKEPPTRPAEPLSVYTTFWPTTEWTRRIGGPLVEVSCPLPEGADAITWKPSRDVLRAYQKADLVVINGARFEKWVERASLPLAKLVDTARGFKPEWLRYEERITHSHGKDGEHSHEGVDGHTWLDPKNAERQARAILSALERRLPEHTDALRERFDVLRTELQLVDKRLAKVGATLAGRHLYASHPAYNYLAKRYGLSVLNLDLDPERVPGDEALAELAARLEEEPSRWILWESEPAPEVAAALSAVGLESVLFEPLENPSLERRDAGLEYVKAMTANAERLDAALAR